MAGSVLATVRGMVSEINVTPLVDVMLVLLIIFMVAAPIATTGVPVALPKGETQTIESEESKLILTIPASFTGQRGVLGKTAFPSPELETKLKTNDKLLPTRARDVHPRRRAASLSGCRDGDGRGVEGRGGKAGADH